MINNNSLVENNVVYKSQFSIIAFVVMLVFKMGMLPSYMCHTAGKDSWFVMAILMIVEAIMFVVVCKISGKINLLCDQNKWLYIIHFFIYILSITRIVVLFSGLVTYTSGILFDTGETNFVILAFALVIPYLASKGGNAIARLFEFSFYFLAVTLLIMFFTVSIKADYSGLFPILTDVTNTFGNGFIDYAVWFGDYIPLLYFVVKDNKNKKLNKISLPFALIVAIVAVIFFYLSFFVAYGNAGELVYFAFNRMAVFNKISELLGSTSFLSIIVWLTMALLQITLIFLTATNSLMKFVKNKTIAILINTVLIVCVQFFAVKNLETAHGFATGGVKYFVILCQFVIPIFLLIYSKIATKNQKKVQK